MREDKGLRIRRTLREHSPHHLRDDVARALHDHAIPDPNVAVTDFILVVQGGPAHDDAADTHGLQFGHRRQHARPPHLNGDVKEARRGLLRGEFPRHGETRGAGRVAERLLRFEIIELHDDAINLIGQRFALFGQFRVVGLHRCGPAAQAPGGVSKPKSRSRAMTSA